MKPVIKVILLTLGGIILFFLLKGLIIGLLIATVAALVLIRPTKWAFVVPVLILIFGLIWRSVPVEASQKTKETISSLWLSIKEIKPEVKPAPPEELPSHPDAVLYQILLKQLNEVETSGKDLARDWAGATDWEQVELKYPAPLLVFSEKGWIPEPRGLKLNWEKPAWADFRLVVKVPGIPENLVPIGQPGPDRTDWALGFTWYSAVAPLELPLAKWGVSLPRNNIGDIEVIDRYIAILQPGQWAENLVYCIPSVTKRDLEKYHYRWHVHVGGQATVKVVINGRLLVINKKGDVVDSSMVEGDSVTCRVYLCKDAEQKELPVEFIYYRQEKGG